ncbi:MICRORCHIDIA 7-like protein [Drosera capensis]
MTPVDGGDDLDSPFELSSSDSLLNSSDDGEYIISSIEIKRRNFLDEREVDEAKRKKVGIAAVPVGFLAPIEGKHGGVVMENNGECGKGKVVVRRKSCKQFWKARDCDEGEGGGGGGFEDSSSASMDSDKHGFERTIELSRLEARLNGHARTNKSSKGNVFSDTNGHTGNASAINTESYKRFNETSTSPECPSEDGVTGRDNGIPLAQETLTKKEKVNEDEYTSNNRLTKRLREVGDSSVQKLIRDLQCERDRSRSLESQLQNAKQKLRDQVLESEKKLKEMDEEQETLIEVFQEERERRDAEEDRLRKQLKRASVTMEELVEKVKRLEKTIPICKTEK